jgi:predicted alpha/beta-fold hydrolase
VRMNMRSCGGSDALAPTIYHSGRSEDVGSVVEALVGAHGIGRIALVGYSMGGNLVLKYAGEQGERHGALRAVVGVSPLMDLAPSSAALHHWSNRLYEQRFLRAMKRRLRLKAALFPGLYAQLEQEGVYGRIRTMRDFDGQIVARYGGFRDADDYYERVRSSRYAASLRVQTLILQAEDDPFIRTLPATREALRANPFVTLVETKHGGHCAFVADAEDGRDGRWAEETIARWLASEIAA